MLTRREMLARSGAAAAALAAGGTLPQGAAAGTPSRAAGYLKGFASLTDEVRLPGLDVDGRMPSWLGGSLLRNGPALFEVGDERFNHWFDGLAMLHAFSFSRGRVSYANRFLRTSAWEAWRRRGRIEYSEFATDPCRSIFSGLTALLAPIPNANVSIEQLADRFVAHTEVAMPVRFDGRTLRTLGVAGGTPGRLGTAHPHADPRTKERFRYEIDLIPPSGLRIVAEKGGARRELAFLPRAEPGYLHSFALTPRWVVVLEQPFVVDPLGFLSPDRKPIIENYRWEPSRPTTLTVLDRASGGVVGTSELDAFFVFHHVNAFERGGKVLLDVCAHEDAGIVDALYLKRLRAGSKIPAATLRRIELAPTGGRATVRDLADVDVELPRTWYDRVNGRDYRYMYGVGRRDVARTGFIDRLVKVDVRSGATRTWSERDAYPGEPVFVPRPDARREDDGVLLSVVLEGRRGRSSLLVLDARSLEEIARAQVPHHIPFGFHGLHAPARRG